MLGLLVGGRYDHSANTDAPPLGLWRRLMKLLFGR